MQRLNCPLTVNSLLVIVDDGCRGRSPPRHIAARSRLPVRAHCADCPMKRDACLRVISIDRDLECEFVAAVSPHQSEKISAPSRSCARRRQTYESGQRSRNRLSTLGAASKVLVGRHGSHRGSSLHGCRHQPASVASQTGRRMSLRTAPGVAGTHTGGSFGHLISGLGPRAFAAASRTSLLSWGKVLPIQRPSVASQVTSSTVR
jgi:hypothetical protein